MTRFLVEPGECHQFLSFLERLVRSDLTTGVPKTLWLNRFKECVDLWDILKTLMIQAGLVKCLLDAICCWGWNAFSAILGTLQTDTRTHQ